MPSAHPSHAARWRRALWLFAIAAAPCAAQPENQPHPPPDPAEPPVPAPPAPQIPPPSSLPLPAAHDFEANIDGGGKISSSAAAVRFGYRQPLSEQLFLGVSVGAGARHCDFRGDSGLVPGSTEAPWDTAYSYSVGVSAIYRASQQVTLFSALNGSSSGEEGADFDDTLTGGVSGGITYSFSRDLTLGLAATVQTRLEDSLLFIPFPTINWTLPGDPRRRWRLRAGHVEGGPPTAAGAAISFEPSEQVSLFAGVGVGGLAGDFRLDDDGPAPGGVARGRVFPLIAGIDWTPGALRLSAYAGIMTFGEIELLDANGDRLGRRGVDPAPTVGAILTWRF